ncbi:hypothetical protein C7M84_009525 [Penaeus vannamei]|uniref:Uncharacterized protein n=1 Tax=Penaeus vannamei TaxID=6689 RepID=A0A423T6F5_PENVA|nr:hypothetical protein C7M84_009525 [Penaeus vannamei]
MASFPLVFFCYSFFVFLLSLLVILFGFLVLSSLSLSLSLSPSTLLSLSLFSLSRLLFSLSSFYIFFLDLLISFLFLTLSFPSSLLSLSPFYTLRSLILYRFLSFSSLARDILSLSSNCLSYSHFPLPSFSFFYCSRVLPSSPPLASPLSFYTPLSLSFYTPLSLSFYFLLSLLLLPSSRLFLYIPHLYPSTFLLSSPYMLTSLSTLPSFYPALSLSFSTVVHTSLLCLSNLFSSSLSFLLTLHLCSLLLHNLPSYSIPLLYSTFSFLSPQPYIYFPSPLSLYPSTPPSPLLSISSLDSPSFRLSSFHFPTQHVCPRSRPLVTVDKDRCLSFACENAWENGACTPILDYILFIPRRNRERAVIKRPRTSAAERSGAARQVPTLAFGTFPSPPHLSVIVRRLGSQTYVYTLDAYVCGWTSVLRRASTSPPDQAPSGTPSPRPSARDDLATPVYFRLPYQLAAFFVLSLALCC